MNVLVLQAKADNESFSFSTLDCYFVCAARGARRTCPVVFEKPVTMVVPYLPAGPIDIVAWVVGQKLGERLGQQVIVDNHPGVGGNIGAALVARAAPDGYTLLLCTTAHAINPSVFPALNYDILKDFSPMVQLTALPLVVRSSLF